MNKSSLVLSVVTSLILSQLTYAEGIKDYKVFLSVRVNKVEKDKAYADLTFYTSDNFTKTYTNWPFLKGRQTQGESENSYYATLYRKDLEPLLSALFNNEQITLEDSQAQAVIGFSKNAAKKSPIVFNRFSKEGAMLFGGPKGGDLVFTFPGFKLPEPNIPQPNIPSPQSIRVQASFALNQYNLDVVGPSGKKPREILSEALKNIPASEYQASYTVIGYASPDSTDAASQQSDMTLSKNRAEAVAQLMRQMGFKNVSSEGRGQTIQFTQPLSLIGEWLQKRKHVNLSSPASVADLFNAKEKALYPNRVIVIQKN